MQLCGLWVKPDCSLRSFLFLTFTQKKPEVPPPSTNPFLEDEAGTETDEIVIEKSDAEKVSF